MKIRWLAIVGMCTLGALTVSGCQSNIGTAAVVDGSKISESDVNRYVDPATAEAGQARNLSLQYQIREKLFTVALDRKNAIPSDQQLQAQHDLAVSNLIGQQVSGAQGDKALRDLMSQNGLKQSFADVLTHAFELELYYAKQTDAQQEQVVEKDLAGQHIPVSVNPRYGSWDTSKFAFTGLSSRQLPSNVTVGGQLPGDVTQSNSQ